MPALLSLGAALALLGASVGSTAAQQLPQVGNYFDFNDNIYLTDGTGNYTGYTETETSNYHYQVTRVVGDNVTLDGRGPWSWSNSTGTSSEGYWAENFSFSTSTRLYTQGFDVLGPYTDPSVWFWVPTPLSVGETVRILDTNYTVESLSATYWTPNFPYVAYTGAELFAAGTYTRNDIYGVYTATYTDTYYFDPTTGWVLAEYYDESDSGAEGGFQYDEQVWVTQASFPLHLDYLSLLAVYGGIPALFVGAIYSVIWYHRGPRHAPIAGPGGSRRATIRRVHSWKRLRGTTPTPDSAYGPFYAVFARRALALKDPLLVATEGTVQVGYLVQDRETGTTTLSAPNGAVAHRLAQMRRPKTAIVEVTDPTWTPAATFPKAAVIDRFQVLELTSIRPPPYDTDLVRPVQWGDLPQIAEIARREYQSEASRGLASMWLDGEIGFVAAEGGTLFGFGFATVAGDTALLHSLTVVPASRNLGVGTDLVAARLGALAALGVRRVRVEIAETNAASLAIARKLGFTPIGRSYYLAFRARATTHEEMRGFE